jgi:hypothetical protein
MYGSTDEFDKILEKYKLQHDRLVCLVTDFSPAMTGSKNGVVEKLNGELDIHIHSCHYIIWWPG